MLSNGASVKSGDGRGRTPLHRACSGCNDAVVKVTNETLVSCLATICIDFCFCRAPMFSFHQPDKRTPTLTTGSTVVRRRPSRQLLTFLFCLIFDPRVECMCVDFALLRRR